MTNEVKTPEELLDEIRNLLKSFNILGMTNYIGTDPSIFTVWRRRKVLPYRNVKRIVEYLEMHNDDVVDLCGKLMDYYKVREKERNDRIEASIERNRQRSRDRYLANKK